VAEGASGAVDHTSIRVGVCEAALRASHLIYHHLGGGKWEVSARVI
jgi:hypothetical protein